MKRVKHLSALIIFAMWILAVCVAFWWFQVRWISSLDDYTSDAWFDAETLQIPAVTQQIGKITLYHFYDETCPCTKFNTQHVIDVEAKYRSKNVELIVLVPSKEAIEDARETFPNAVDVLTTTSQFAPPASPAVLVTSAEAKPEYIGPWSPGAVCNGKDEDFVSAVVDELILGKKYEFIRNYAQGCLCPWPILSLS
ncbi:MAG: DUF6436 domain-containing protein [Pontibacterium sp.]